MGLFSKLFGGGDPAALVELGFKYGHLNASLPSSGTPFPLSYIRPKSSWEGTQPLLCGESMPLEGLLVILRRSPKSFVKDNSKDALCVRMSLICSTAKAVNGLIAVLDDAVAMVSRRA